MLNSKGEDVTNDKNIVLEKEITDGKVKILLDKIDKDEEYKIVYDVIYAKSEEGSLEKSTTKVKGLNTKTVLNSNGNVLDENENDKSGISAKVVTNVLSVEDRAVEEEEFKKKTELKITKTKEKENVKDGEKNTYSIVVKNIGDNPARIVKIEDTIERKKHNR